MTERETFLKILKDAVFCYDICSAPKDMACDCRSVEHIKECKRFRPKGKENEQRND